MAAKPDLRLHGLLILPTLHRYFCVKCLIDKRFSEGSAPRHAQGREAGALPTNPYSRIWGYGPSGGIGLVLLIVLILLLTGRV